MPRKIFKNLVIATAGPLPGQLTAENLRQWTALRKGVFTEDYDDQVTHLLCTHLFHIYTDRTFFSYQIDITRNDTETGDLGQRYTLYLWESNAKPHLYWFAAKFIKKKGASQPSFHRPSPCSGPWRRQMDLFMDFFRIKTGIEWQDRVIGQGTMPSSYFQYSPPTGGKPVGRRLRFCYEYCLEINAQLRGLPWPPVEEAQVKDEDGASEPHDTAKLEHDDDGVTSTSGTPLEDDVGVYGTEMDVSMDEGEEEGEEEEGEEEEGEEEEGEEEEGEEEEGEDGQEEPQVPKEP
ncbi:hypothetical protein A9Z42_0019050 [Trichoderma parareesei]|uniref:Uncharacterized protein n=1 Tax=Trichoderma parareesei TaxID=858221 RepID=A0A2H2Z524_TRIPA|nr:hypothetical protein A9Z42_0019050 [Trichoderma parareesei]